MADAAVTGLDTEAFDAFDQTLRAEGPGAAIDQLIRRLDERGQYRALLDALLLKARHELGLPLIHTGSLNDLPEPARSRFEERYVEAIRTVGQKWLDAGDLPAAWPYFRAIAEPEPVARAIDAYQPAEGVERLGQVVEIAFNHGANPRKGFALILDHYGICSAISAFESLPQDESIRVSCAEKLVRNLHAQLVANLRAEIAQRGQPLPPEGTPIDRLIEGRDWLFADDAYHLDVSHLAAVVRLSPLLTDPEPLGLAVELTDYGRKLSPRHRYEGEPPFEDVYKDHGVYLRALVGRDVEAAIAHFRVKLVPSDPVDPNPAETLPAQVLVGLLLRLDRLEEAIDVAAENLAGLPESLLVCPGISQLCQRAGNSERLARLSREHGDLVNYAAAVLEQQGKPHGKFEQQR
jgi:hypothetical protein